MYEQQLRGGFIQEIWWKIPVGINLNDEEIYEYDQDGSTLYITNKKTGEKWEIEAHHRENSDDKYEYCDYLEVEDVEDYYNKEWDRNEYPYPFVLGLTKYDNPTKNINIDKNIDEEAFNAELQKVDNEN